MLKGNITFFGLVERRPGDRCEIVAAAFVDGNGVRDSFDSAVGAAGVAVALVQSVYDDKAKYSNFHRSC